jgi:hypothetical protein
MRILADEPRRRLVLKSPRALLRRPFAPTRDLTFAHERLQVRQGPWSATFRFLDVKHFELRRERVCGPRGEPVHDVVSLWLHVHLPDELERRIQEGRSELFRVVHHPWWFTEAQAAHYNRMYRALEELGFDVHAVTPHPRAPPERPFLSGEKDPDLRKLRLLEEQRRRKRQEKRQWREQGWGLAVDTVQLLARLSGEMFLVTALTFGALVFCWWLFSGRS